MLALALEHEMCFLLADLEIVLQDTLGAINHLSPFQPIHQLRLLVFQTRHFDLGAYRKPIVEIKLISRSV